MSLRVLLIEDNEFNQMVMVETLMEWKPNIVVDLAENGQIGVDKLKENKYDIILMDIQMPVMDGHEATLYIRNQMTAPASITPILAVTAHAFQSEADKCIKNGMNDYISKPFEANNLFAKILELTKFENTLSTEKLFEIKVEEKEVSPAVVNPQIIIDFTKGNQERIEKMVNMFLRDTPLELKRLRQLYIEKNFIELGTLVHAFKAKFTYMGMPHLSDLAKKTEHNAKSLENLQDIDGYLSTLESQSELAYEELKKLLK